MMATAEATAHAALSEAATYATLVETVIMKPALMKSRTGRRMPEENVIQAMATMVEVKEEKPCPHTDGGPPIPRVVPPIRILRRRI